MRIIDIQTQIVSVPTDIFKFKRPLGNITRKHASRDYLVVHVQTDDGISGMGYCFTIGQGTRAMRAIVEHDLKKIVLGRDPLMIREIWEAMWEGTNYFGRQGASQFAICAIDVALWDIAGKAAGLPLYKLLGGRRREVRTYATVGFISLTIRELQQAAEDAVKRGFQGVKIVVGHPEVKTDVRRVKAVRKTIGDDTILMVDANQAWKTARRGIDCILELAEFGIYWFEEPVPADDVEGILEVLQSTGQRIVGGENAYTRIQARPFIERRAVHVFQPDLYRMGGITEMMDVVAMARGFNIEIAPHHVPEINVSTMCAAPNCSWLEHVPLFQEDIFDNCPTVKKGMARPPEEPGHGVRFRQNILDEYLVP
ncbi:MAG: mandelate racemase/muconate lactonizing enzyme family protein [Planctomycetes bacterium]|nr:mandelate racemase/muconate lactonizing enzyme family protein [Planctomycetota bacterium]